jgi:tripartite-type tricarboxylate transporter receptor subunit TctC
MGILLTALLCLLALAGPAGAWPDRPIQIIVPFPPGGTNDVVARAIGQVFSETLGTSVAVVNRDGGSGTIGARAVATARPDGHTLGFFPAGVVTIQPQLLREAGYALESFRPICQVFSGGFILATPRTGGFADARAFIAAARRAPGGVSVGIGGNYTIPHWALIGLQGRAGVDFNVVAFRGDPGVIQALLSGDLQVGAMSSGGALGANLPAILALTAERVRDLPEVPTARELGFDVVEEQFGGLVAPVGLPDDVARRLEADCAKAAADARVSGPLRSAGLVVTHRDSAGFAAALRADTVAKRELIATAQLTPR